MKLILLKEAELDIEAALTCYEERQPDLGKQFLDCLDQLYQRIEDNPTHFCRIFGQVRRGLLNLFSMPSIFL